MIHVSFVSGTILANDGKGTPLATTFGTAIMQISKEEVIDEEPELHASLPVISQTKSSTQVRTMVVIRTSEERPTPSSTTIFGPQSGRVKTEVRVLPSVKQVSGSDKVGWTRRLSGWWAGILALATPAVTVGIARLGGIRFGVVAALRRRRKVRGMENRIFQLLLHWDENLDRQHTRLKRVAKRRDLTAVEKQMLRDIEKNQLRMHELGDLITDLQSKRKGIPPGKT
ncbi:hypothetical protein FJZ48_01250 [Candidatus Uhrbacteria bacterium]|nr:hypothetical protein [Candidatus Uhrbacteria bacterium]